AADVRCWCLSEPQRRGTLVCLRQAMARISNALRQARDHVSSGCRDQRDRDMATPIKETCPSRSWRSSFRISSGLLMYWSTQLTSSAGAEECLDVNGKRTAWHIESV